MAYEDNYEDKLAETVTRLLQNRRFMEIFISKLPSAFIEEFVAVRATDIIHTYRHELDLPEIHQLIRGAYISELGRFNGSVTRFASHYGILRTNVYKHLRKLDIHREDYKITKSA